VYHTTVTRRALTNSSVVPQRRRVCLTTAPTRASTFLTRWSSSAISRSWRISACFRLVISRVNPFTRIRRPVVSKSAASVSRLPANAMLETKNLSRAVDGKVLVDDVSVQMQPGEIIAVVGPSGAGKSSFLRLIDRLDEPTSGTVLLNGNDYRASYAAASAW